MNIQHRVRKLIFSITLLALLVVNACTSVVHTETDQTSIPAIEPLVSAQWLNEHINDPDLVVLDATVQVDFDDKGELIITNGRAGYEAGHIPTAGFADLMGDLADSNSPYPYAIPSPEQFVKAMGELGVGDDSRVVLYSSNFPAWAARVWWMLRWVGFDNVALLDGGLNAWEAEAYSLSTQPAQEPVKTLSISLRPELIAERDEVFAAISDDNVALVDALPEAHFRGEMTMYGRTGHIPTAINMPNLTGEGGKFLELDELDLMHDGDRSQRAITYCGGGISASSNAFVMHRLGFTDVAVYMGSLQEWAADPENPMTTEP